MRRKALFDFNLYQLVSVGFLLVPAAFFLFCWLSLSSSLMALRGNHENASSLMVLLCFLVVNRVISLALFRLKEKKKQLINDVIGISIFLLLMICGTIYNLSRTTNPSQQSKAYSFFNSSLQKEDFIDIHSMRYDSLLEPESWELFSANNTNNAHNSVIRLTYVDCLTGQIAKKYQQQFIMDYTNAKIQTTEAENYTLITAEGAVVYNDEETGNYVMALMIRKEKTVVILQINGAYNEISKTYDSLVQSVLESIGTRDTVCK